MPKKRKILLLLAALLLLTPILALLLLREPPSTTFDLRDGTQLEILRVSYGTKHVAHFGNLPQKLLFKITGPRLSYQWVGHYFVTPSQDSINGTLGLFVRHRLPPGDHPIESIQNLKIDYDLKTDRIHSKTDARTMFISSGAGEYALWELAGWTEDHSDFTIENSKGEPVARFQIIKDERGRYTISEVQEANTQPPARDPQDEKPALR